MVGLYRTREDYRMEIFLPCHLVPPTSNQPFKPLFTTKWHFIKTIFLRIIYLTDGVKSRFGVLTSMFEISLKNCDTLKPYQFR